MNLYAIRHGETAWSLSGRHTGVTDVPLTDNGRQRAEALRAALAKETFSLVLVSPMQRARETCALAGVGGGAVDPDLMEWNYGEYEGLTPKQIQDMRPEWVLFRDGCPGGETPEQVGIRVDRVIARARASGGDVALFAHGHVLRVLVARWIGLPAERGQHFLLDTGTLCVLGYYYNAPAIKIWNGPPVSAADRSPPIREGIQSLRALTRLRRAEPAPAPREAAAQQAIRARTPGERSMQQPEVKHVISREQYDGVLLDLDGVITDTAGIHAACWKQMFDEYLQKRAIQRGEAFRPFDVGADYRLYVDGKPRFDGVRDFLISRGINLSEGKLDDPPEAETLIGLGNRKNAMIGQIIEELGVQPYEGTVKFIQQLRRRGFKIAVVTSSENCTAVLRAAKLDASFDLQVDGHVIHDQHLAGKPAPDTFLLAAKLLGVEPARAIVAEDAISGVEAGSNGHFGLVIGVARKGNAEELLRHGAQLVVNDLGELVG